MVTSNYVSRAGLIVSALSVGVSLAIKIGTKLTDKGKVADVFARFKVPVSLDSGSIHDAVAKLLKLGQTKINVSVPKTETGLLSMTIRPVQTAERLYVACCYAGGIDYDGSLSREWVNGHLAALQLPILPEPSVSAETATVATTPEPSVSAETATAHKGKVKATANK